MAISFDGDLMKISDPALLKAKDPFIKIRGISKIFKSGAGEFTALDNINLDFYRGEFVCIVGKSGSGNQPWPI